MYIIKRTSENTISYYKYDGWESFPKEGPLDLSNCVLFTFDEAINMVWGNSLAPNETIQWYGAYK